MDARAVGGTFRWRGVACLQGRCDRGVNCKFYHDPSVAQYGEEERLFERLDSSAELNINQVTPRRQLSQGTHVQASAPLATDTLQATPSIQDSHLAGGRCIAPSQWQDVAILR